MAENDTTSKAKPLAEVTLPASGKKATVTRKLKGKDLRLAAKIGGGNDTVLTSYALVACVTLLDGKSFVAEDMDEMDMEDIQALLMAVPGLGKSLASEPDTSSS